MSEMKFLDVRTDFAFKKVFGSASSKPQLTSFLNALLEFPKGAKIVDLTIEDPYNIPMIKGMKDTYVDVKARLDNDTRVIIEMQVLFVDGFEARILYNAAKNYSAQLVRGENYTLLNPVIALTIADFPMFPKTDRLITRFKLIEKDTLIHYKDDIQLVFVELEKFNKSLEACETITDRWLYFLKNSEKMTTIPDDVEQEIKEAFAVANEAGLTSEELEAQHKRKDFIILQKGSIKRAERIGREEGEKRKAAEIAINLLDILDDGTIAAKTGLAIEQVKDLRKGKR